MANPFDAVVSGVLGAPEQGLGEALGQAVEVTKSFGGIGDVGSMVGGITGSDPFTNLRQSSWERLFAIASLAGIGSAVTAYRASKGQHVLNWARDSYPTQPVRTSGALLAPVPSQWGGPPRLLPVGPTPSDLAKLHQPLPDQDIFWATTKGFTNRYLEVDPRQADTGWARLAQAVVNTDEPPANFAQVDAFVYDLGHRLVAEAIPHAGNEPLDAARWGLAQWESALDQGVLKGKTGKQARKIWQRLQAGHEIDLEEEKILSDSITRFQSTLGWIDHPELALHPQLRLSKVDLDGPDAEVEFDFLHFEGKSVASMSKEDAQARMAALFGSHPAAMVPLLTENVTNFYRRYVETAPDLYEGGENSIWQQWRDWYPTARRDADKVAADLGTASTEQVTVVASVLSGGEGWETNLPKAKKLIQLVQSEPMSPGYFKRVHQAATKMGLKSSEEDVVRAYVAMQLDDPVALFETGDRTANALTLKQVAEQIEAGVDPTVAAQKRSLSAAHQSLKQDEFAYSILFSHDEDLAQRTETLVRMMAGKTGAEGDIHFSEGRKALPVVVDRQAVKIALGMSLEPPTALSSKMGMFDAFAQAYRIAAAQLGEIPELGRRLTPEELQAITWMRWRELARVKAKTEDGEAAVRDIYDKGVKHAPNFLQPGRSVAGWTEGSGPDYVFDDRVLRLIQGEDYRLALSGAGAIDAGQDPYRLAKNAELAQPGERPPAKEMWKTAKVRVDSQGNMDLLGAQQLGVRGRWPTFARVEGNVVMAPTRRARIDDAMAQFKRMAQTAYDVENPDKIRGTGVRIYRNGSAPSAWLEPGHHTVINAPVEYAGGHDALVAELKALGIKVEVTKNTPHKGYTTEWGEETKLGATYTFDSVDDMEAAHRYLHTPEPDGEMVIVGQGDDATEVPSTPARRLFHEHVLDQGYYTDGPASAPKGTVALHEFQFEDANGNVLVHLNKAGDVARSNAVTVFVPEDFAGYITPVRTRSMDFGTGGHFLEPESGILDGQAQIIAPGRKLKTDKNAKGSFPSSIKVDGKAHRDWWIHLDPAGLPQISTEKLPGWMEDRTFHMTWREVYKKPNTKGDMVDVPAAWSIDAKGKNPVMASEVLDLLYRVGLDKRVEFGL